MTSTSDRGAVEACENAADGWSNLGQNRRKSAHFHRVESNRFRSGEVDGDDPLVVVVAVRARLRLHERFTHGQRGRHIGLDEALRRDGVGVAAVANLAGAFVTTAVAKTVGKGIIDTGLATEQTILAALIGAIAWNLFTWWLGLPSSSSHALIGGLIGAALVQSGSRGVEWHDIAHKVAIPALLAPTLAFLGAFVLLRRTPEGVTSL